MKMILSLYFILAFMSISALSLPFQTVDKGQYSAVEDAITEVYRTRKDFETFWKRHASTSYPPSGVPDVDFAKQMVAVVFRGTRNSGGYDIEITSVDQDEGDGRLVVNFLTSDPPPGALLTMAITQPYHMISLDRSDKSIVFVGSAKPLPPPRFPTFILTLVEEDKDAIVARIKALPSVKNVRVMDRLAIAMVDFHSESISKEEARNVLDGIEGVKTIEEE